MASHILMPRQGNTVESCIILEWKKREGDSVTSGEVLCEVETDKASFEVESELNGTLLKIYFGEGEDVPVLTPIAVIGEKGEDITGLDPKTVEEASPGVTDAEVASSGISTGASATTAAASSTSLPSGATPPSDGVGRIAISPRARRLAERNGFDFHVLAGGGSGPRGRIIEQDVRKALASGAPELATGLPKAASAGIVSVAAATPAASGADLGFPGPSQVLEIKGVRKIVAERMHASLSTTAQLTLQGSADARAILSYRKKLKQSPEGLGLQNITINDLVLYATVKTLARNPELNGTFIDGQLQTYQHVHAGFAVDTPRGLIVPVVRFADSLSLKELAGETKRLGKACIEGSVIPDELAGGTFTMTNLGALGVEMFTPILNAPQLAILGVCSIEPKPVFRGEEVVHHPHIGLSLTIDHQVVDGSPGARFLKELSEVIADIDLSLAG